MDAMKATSMGIMGYSTYLGYLPMDDFLVLGIDTLEYLYILL